MCYVKAGAGKFIIIISSMHMCMMVTYGISIQVSFGGRPNMSIASQQEEYLSLRRYAQLRYFTCRSHPTFAITMHTQAGVSV